MSLAKDIGKMLSKPKVIPLWHGPEVDGITQSLLSLFLICRERFRIRYVEGLKPRETFSHRQEFGNLWHAAEEGFALDGNWQRHLDSLIKNLMAKYPMQQGEIYKWLNVVRTQFPIYIEHWKKHGQTVKRIPLLQEQEFDLPYKLPSGRTVRLRGKWDAVDLIDGKVWLFETKTKGDVDPFQLQRQLRFDLQTMLYLTALTNWRSKPIKELEQRSLVLRPVGVRYNVIKRPLSGGKGSITQSKGTQGAKCSACKGEGVKNLFPCIKCGGKGRLGGKPTESDQAFYQRLGKVISEQPEEFFFRWNVEVSQKDVERFRRECLDPVLEQLSDWWEWIYFEDSLNSAPFHSHIGGSCRKDIGYGIHWRMPYGLYNPMLEGNPSDLDEFIDTGNEVGLTRVTTVFPELKGDKS